MNFNLVFLANLLLLEELLYILTLIALQLNNFAELFVLNNGSVACELLLDELQNLLRVVF